MARKLYLAAYDVVSSSRRRRLLKLIRAHSVGQQKSVFECLLSRLEWGALMAQVTAVLDQEEDYFLLLPLERSQSSYPLGLAVSPLSSECYCIG